MIVIELLIFLSTVLPIFHLINALISRRRVITQTPRAQKRFCLLIPCYNEEDTVAISLRGLQALNYQNYEAIYINDGSTDNTLQTLADLLDLSKYQRPSGCPGDVTAIYRSKTNPRIRVVDRSNGGKSAALNTGILLAKSRYIVTLDADSVLERDALSHMNRAFEDKNLVAAGGSIHIMQAYGSDYQSGSLGRLKTALISLQLLEYLKGFYIYKFSLAKQNATAIISGAFGVFRKDILLAVGGFRKTLGEDIDITMRIQQLIHRTRQQIQYLPEALCFTQCPEGVKDLMKQRLRWQKGFIDCAHYHRKFLLTTFFRCSMSFHFFVEALAVGVCSCIFTVFSYLFAGALAFHDPNALVVFLFYYVSCLVFYLLYTLGAIFMSGKYSPYPKGVLRRALVSLLLDIFVFRYFSLAMYLLGTIQYYWNQSGNHNWNKVARVKREYLAIDYNGGYHGKAVG